MIQPIEEIDSEFAEQIKDVVNKKTKAIIFNTKVFDTSIKPFKEVTLDVGRNDPCFCGSMKKYKKCCGQ